MPDQNSTHLSTLPLCHVDGVASQNETPSNTMRYVAGTCSRWGSVMSAVTRICHAIAFDLTKIRLINNLGTTSGSVAPK